VWRGEAARRVRTPRARREGRPSGARSLALIGLPARAPGAVSAATAIAGSHVRVIRAVGTCGPASSTAGAGGRRCPPRGARRPDGRGPRAGQRGPMGGGPASFDRRAG